MIFITNLLFIVSPLKCYPSAGRDLCLFCSLFSAVSGTVPAHGSAQYL